MRALTRVAAAFALASVVLAFAFDCGDTNGAQATVSWPVGTVLAVDDVPINVEEVDHESIWIQPIEPGVSAPQLRRLALTNIVLPRLISRLMAPSEHTAARQEADETLARLRAGEFVGPPNPEGGVGTRITGGWQELGIVAWGVALELEDGAWSEVVEDCGRFFVLRRLKRIEGVMPIATRVEVDLFSFPWLPLEDLRDSVDRAHAEHALTIVDPEWKAIVPELIQYRMGVHE